MTKVYIQVTNSENERLTVEVRSKVQLANALQARMIPMTAPQYSSSTILKQLSVYIQITDPESTLFLKTVCAFYLDNELYNGLEVYTVVSPEDDDKYATKRNRRNSFSDEGNALNFLIEELSEHIKQIKEGAKDEN